MFARPSFNVVGKNHKLYARKAYGESLAKHRKPSLNTRDYAECYEHLDDPSVLRENRALIFAMYDDLRTLMGRSALEMGDCGTEAAAEDGTPAAPRDAPLTIGEAARFIVDRADAGALGGDL